MEEKYKLKNCSCGKCNNIIYDYAEEMAKFIITGFCQKISKKENILDAQVGTNLQHPYYPPIKLLIQTDYITTDYINEEGGREGYEVFNEKLSEEEQIQILQERIFAFLD